MKSKTKDLDNVLVCLLSGGDVKKLRLTGSVNKSRLLEFISHYKQRKTMFSKDYDLAKAEGVYEFKKDLITAIEKGLFK